MSGRCECCNSVLSDYEMTLKHAITLEYLNTCRKCLTGLMIPTIGREDLDPYESIEDDYDVMDNQENEDDE